MVAQISDPITNCKDWNWREGTHFGRGGGHFQSRGRGNHFGSRGFILEGAGDRIILEVRESFSK